MRDACLHFDFFRGAKLALYRNFDHAPHGTGEVFISTVLIEGTEFGQAVAAFDQQFDMAVDDLMRSDLRSRSAVNV
jgi:hypothetical protein